MIVAKHSFLPLSSRSYFFTCASPRSFKIIRLVLARFELPIPHNLHTSTLGCQNSLHAILPEEEITPIPSAQKLASMPAWVLSRLGKL